MKKPLPVCCTEPMKSIQVYDAPACVCVKCGAVHVTPPRPAEFIRFTFRQPVAEEA